MKIIGHRGARGLAPENTLAGLRKGLQYHVDMLEFDLRVTRDGIPVLHHDPKLVDPAGNKLKLAEHSYAELKAHKPDLPTFEEVLDKIGHPVQLYVEVKPGEPVGPIVNIIKQRLADGWKPEHFRLASFSQATLLELQAALPGIEKTVIEKWSGVRAKRRMDQLGHNHLIINQRWLWWGYIRLMTKRGYKVGAYTVNNPAQARRWQKHGLRAIVTDYPDRFE